MWGGPFPAPKTGVGGGVRDVAGRAWARRRTEVIAGPGQGDLSGQGRAADVRIGASLGAIRALIPRKRVIASNPHILLVWMGATAALRTFGGQATPIPGRVVSVSADVIDGEDGAYFLAEIGLDGASPPIGAPVQGLIFGEPKTIWSGFAGPLRRRFDRAMREE